MTLQEAYQGWQEQEQNRKLFTKTREAFRKAWFQLPTNKPCSYYTKEILGEALHATGEVHENKSKAASVMVHVLTFAHLSDPDDNPNPKFTFDDLMKSAQALVKPKSKKPQITQKDTDNLLNTDYKDYKETAAEQPQANPSVKSIKSVLNKKSVSDKNICDTQKSPCESVSSVAKEESAAKPKRTIRKVDDDICQLDTKTLKVIKRWPHALRIKQELGIHNVVRAIERCGQAGGFYWSYSKDLDTFAARLAAHKEHNAEVHKNHCAQMRAAKEPQNTQKAATKREDSEARIDSPEREQARPKVKTSTKDTKDTEKVKPQIPQIDTEKAINTEQKPSVKPKASKKTAAVCDNKKSPCESVSSVANRPSVASLALAVFTDEELFAELDRRGWFGYFSRAEIVTIGNK